jgi:hypothetical protein
LAAVNFAVLLSGAWIEVVALVAAFAIAATTIPEPTADRDAIVPASGGVTPTNLLYNATTCC